jgi:hypothetical protein
MIKKIKRWWKRVRSPERQSVEAAPPLRFLKELCPYCGEAHVGEIIHDIPMVKCSVMPDNMVIIGNVRISIDESGVSPVAYLDSIMNKTGA